MKNAFLLRLFISLLIGSICLFHIPSSTSARGLNDSFQEGKESLHGVLLKVQLDPPLRDDLKCIQFSPDGKYIFAQDDSGINVLTRSPFALLFRIDAPGVIEALFSPDSRTIFYCNSDLRVYSWNVADQKLTSTHDISSAANCNQSRLSPDGKTLACLELGRNLVLFDVATNAQILRQDDFLSDPFEGMLVLFPGELFYDDALNRQVNMEFSPDGHYFAAGVTQLRQRALLDKTRVVADAAKTENPPGYRDDPNNISINRPSVDVYRPGENAESSKAIAYDVTKRKHVSLGGQLKDILAGGFTFIGSERVVGVNRQDRAKSALVNFPAGDTIKILPLEQGKLDAPGRGNYVLIRPLKKYPVGVMNLADGSLLMANKKSALDIYEDIYVAERADGEVGLYGLAKNDLRFKIQLPRSSLTYVGAVALATDFSLLATSGRTRAAVWDLKKGERLFYLRNFNGAYYAENGTFYVDFPKQDSVNRTIAVLQPEQREVIPAREIEDSEVIRMRQHGLFLVIMRRADPASLTINTAISVLMKGPQSLWNENGSLEVKNVQTMTSLWTRAFPKETPAVWVDAFNESMILRWDLTDEAAKIEIKRDPRLSKQLAAMKDKDGDKFLQVVDTRTGQPRGSLLLESEKGSLFFWQVFAVNGSVVTVDSTKHVRVYSLVSGEQVGIVPGFEATATRTSGLLCVESEEGKLTIYDLASMRERDQFVFAGPIAFARFSDDGKRLFVLTRSQSAYVLDVSSSAINPK